MPILISSSPLNWVVFDRDRPAPAMTPHPFDRDRIQICQIRRLPSCCKPLDPPFQVPSYPLEHSHQTAAKPGCVNNNSATRAGVCRATLNTSKDAPAYKECKNLKLA
ncbi:hypothetical protein [Microcoleus asticus]|uniref:hypothetical protein n=1 Tax=Microcoleus asticus TaxID=2815231 RepID=UPI0015523F63|nr:hypothetical protein [Microcoleus asticus]